MFLTVTWMCVFVFGALIVGFLSGMLTMYRKVDEVMAITHKWKLTAEASRSKIQDAFNRGYKIGLTTGTHNSKVMAELQDRLQS